MILALVKYSVLQNMGRKSKAEERKQEILEHFYKVMLTEGFENSSIAKIAKSMDVNPSLLIHYFKTKEDMVVGLVDFLLERYEDAFLNMVISKENPQEQFDTVIDILFGHAWMQMSDQHSVFYACYYLSSRHDLIRERFQQMYNRFREVVEELADRWIEAKIVRDFTPSQVAEYLIMLNEGLTYYEGVYRDPEAFMHRCEYLQKMVRKTLTA